MNNPRTKSEGAKGTTRLAKRFLSDLAQSSVKKAKTNGKKAHSPNQTWTPEDQFARTQQIAYELYEKRGYKDGYDRFDWSIAEALVKLEMAKANRPAIQKKPLSLESLMKRVEEKAFEYFTNRGLTHGDDQFDWYLAERVVQLENS